MAPISRKLTDADQVMKFKCDVHPWMTAYVLVAGNPFFAVTGDDGSFKITGVPAGKYTVEAWHERYGTKTAEITVDADKAAETAFQFSAGPERVAAPAATQLRRRSRPTRAQTKRNGRLSDINAPDVASRRQSGAQKTGGTAGRPPLCGRRPRSRRSC